MNAIIFLLSLLTGLMFGGVVVIGMVVILEIELEVWIYIIIYIACTAIGTYGMYKDINGN